MRTCTRHRLAVAVVLTLCAACRPAERHYALRAVDGRELPFTMSTYAGDKQSQIMWSTLHWRTDGRVEHRFRYRSLNADGTADTLQLATDMYLVDEDAREVRLSRWAPAGMFGHRADSVLVTDTLTRDGADVLWHERLNLAEGGLPDSIVTRVLRFVRTKSRDGAE